MRYNRSYLLLLLAAVIITQTNCKKFLDVKPKGLDIITTTEQYNGLLNNATLFSFNNIRNSPGGIALLLGAAEMPLYMGDDVFSSSAFMSNVTYIPFQNGFKWGADLYLPTDEANDWGAYYNQLYPYNVIVEGVMNSEGGTTEKKKELLAEAKACRAFNHFIVANYFGQPYNANNATTALSVPILKTADVTVDNFQRATVQELYDFVINELKEAIPDLQAKPYSRLRMSRPAAQYMLGMVYFQMRKYPEALVELNNCRTGIVGGPVPVSLYDYNVTMTTAAPTGWYTASQPYKGASGYPQLYLSNETIFTRQISINGTVNRNCLFLKPAILNLFGPNDLRKRMFLDKNVSNGTITLPGYIRNSQTNTSIGPNLPNLLLMLAECKARANDLTGAKADLETLRKSRMPLANATVTAATTDDMVRFCLEERHREYASSGMRWFDMRRLYLDPTYNNLDRTKTFDALTYTLTDERLTMRIPPQILQYNPNMIDNQ